ncbi:MAG: hypothetical protein NPIRA02_37820 [Nitrospirales bacterium]|nr:MAG: hypothetical protein NPIRA02_37820 [Nitrospirales bacterium]
MQKVGEKLAEWAKSESNTQDVDAIGRSAFNRFYYASFLLTREMLGNFDSQLMKARHASIPEILNGSIKKKIQRVSRSRKNMISQKDVSQAFDSLNALSSLLQDAYKVRCDADYCPEKKIIRNGVKGEIFLEEKKLSSASNWQRHAERYVKIIQRVGKNLGLV